MSIVLTMSELMTHLDTVCPPGASTGLVGIDRLTGGLRRGQVWLVVGVPEEGRTTLAVQWAREFAEQGHATVLWTPRQPAADIADRLIAQAGPVPLRGTEGKERRSRAVERVATLPLRVVPKGDGPPPHAALTPGDGRSSTLVIDDADLLGIEPDAVRALVSRTALVVTLPRAQVVSNDPVRDDLDPSWAQVADLVVEVRHRGLPDGDEHLRAGEADLIVLHHRWGPCSRIGVQFQAHYSRFIDGSRPCPPR